MKPHQMYQAGYWRARGGRAALAPQDEKALLWFEQGYRDALREMAAESDAREGIGGER